MQISRITVRNFRNLADLDLKLQPGTVIVGENRAGKSNLLHALRLILDPSLSYADRQLRREDFWDGLSDGSDDWDPMAAGHVIEASVEITDFENSIALITALSDGLMKGTPLRARLTYRFAPIDTGDTATTGARKYQGGIFGGDNEDTSIPRDLRRYLHLQFLHAMRDVESDIRSWRHSPLRDLLEAAARAVSEDNLNEVRSAMKAANDGLNALDEITALGGSISQQLIDMIGASQAVETELAVAPEDPLRLIRNMRLFVDGDAHRHLSSASLGTLNVLYLALLELGLRTRLNDSDIAHVVMAIEEPEAHLHPHAQRLIFRRLLAAHNAHGPGSMEAGAGTVFVTTQSPHIASVADPRSLVALRTVDGATTAATAHTADLSEVEWDDIARYLDATRAELVFARRVLLVEGFAEQVLIPRLADTFGMDLDKRGITVCAIHGTHFSSYVRFCDALQVPWAVITDADAPDAQGVSAGDKRAATLMDLLGQDGSPAQQGIFVGRATFEYDLLTDTRNIAPCFATLSDLCAGPSQKVIAGWGATDPGYEAFMTMITNAGGKGRFAQRLALHDLYPPRYVIDALQHLAR